MHADRRHLKANWRFKCHSPFYHWSETTVMLEESKPTNSATNNRGGTKSPTISWVINDLFEIYAHIEYSWHRCCENLRSLITRLTPHISRAPYATTNHADKHLSTPSARSHQQVMGQASLKITIERPYRSAQEVCHAAIHRKHPFDFPSWESRTEMLANQRLHFLLTWHLLVSMHCVGEVF